jgi:hypothetical protein
MEPLTSPGLAHDASPFDTDLEPPEQALGRAHATVETVRAA